MVLVDLLVEDPILHLAIEVEKRFDDHQNPRNFIDQLIHLPNDLTSSKKCKRGPIAPLPFHPIYWPVTKSVASPSGLGIPAWTRWCSEWFQQLYKKYVQMIPTAIWPKSEITCYRLLFLVRRDFLICLKTFRLYRNVSWIMICRPSVTATEWAHIESGTLRLNMLFNFISGLQYLSTKAEAWASNFLWH